MLKNAEEWRWCIHHNHDVQEEKIKHNVKRKGNLYEKIIRNKRNIPHPIIEYNKSVSPLPEILFFKIAIK